MGTLLLFKYTILVVFLYLLSNSVFSYSISSMREFLYADLSVLSQTVRWSFTVPVYCCLAQLMLHGVPHIAEMTLMHLMCSLQVLNEAFFYGAPSVAVKASSR